MRYNILLVEDNPGDVVLTKMALENAGLAFDLHSLGDGRLAVEYLNQIGTVGSPPCPDLLLLDIGLPIISGSEVLRRLREHPGCRDTLVVITSSTGDPNEKRVVESHGVDRIMAKPDSLDNYLKFGSMIRDLLEDRPCNRTTELPPPL